MSGRLLGHAVGVENPLDLPNRPQEMSEMLRVGHLEGESGFGDSITPGLQRSRQDVDV